MKELNEKGYFISYSYGEQLNAGSKAKNDCDQILRDSGYEPIKMKAPIGGIKKSLLSKIFWGFRLFIGYWKCLSMVPKNSILVVQHPAVGVEFLNIITKLFPNIKIVSLIHDLETLRDAGWITKSNKRAQIADYKFLPKSYKIICHNQVMMSYLEKQGIDRDKLVNLEIFDYLEDNDFSQLDRGQYNRRVIIAGNLSPKKSGYIYNIPKMNVNFELFGINCDEDRIQKTTHYNGAYSPNELGKHLNGDFGLVWDGDSVVTCSGATGNYTRYNNPHKASLYIASGLPLIVWREAAISEFVVKNNIGIVVDNINQIESKLDEITKSEYDLLKNNVIKMSEKVQKGYFLKKALCSMEE